MPMMIMLSIETNLTTGIHFAFGWFLTGFQVNPMETRDIIRSDVRAMTLAVNAINLSSSNQNLVRPAQVEEISRAVRNPCWS